MKLLIGSYIEALRNRWSKGYNCDW